MARRAAKRSTVKRRVWELFSKYIRLKYADDNGYVACVTCGKVKHYKEIDAGHFIPKNDGDYFYFLEENVHPQCNHCNRFKGGNLIEYTRFMIDTYGIEFVDELRKARSKPAKITTPDLLDMEQDLKQRLK